MKKSFIGFTLAEVLITLGIIGVVAAMTIPTLIANYQKAQYVTSLKKTYTQFNQIFSQISTDRGSVNDLKTSGLFDSTMNLTKLGDEIVKYVNVSKNCKETTGCFATSTWGNYDGGGGQANYGASGYQFITLDGTAILINVGSFDNCGNNASTGITNNATQVCGDLYVDVNGPQKGPNALGRDTFIFLITNGRGALLYPHGGADYKWEQWQNVATGNPVKCYQADKTGLGCAGRIMEEGWQMNY